MEAKISHMSVSPQRVGMPNVSHAQKATLQICACLFRVLLYPAARVEIPELKIDFNSKTGLIIAANHRSMLDMFVGVIAMRKWRLYPTMLVRGDFCELPVIGRILRALGGLPAGRGYAALSSAKLALNHGRILVLTPEGRVVPPEDRPTGLGKFKPGVGYLAATSEAPILLVAITNTDVCWPLGNRLPRLRFPLRERPVIRFSVDLIQETGDANSRQIVELVHDGLTRLLHESEQ
jgi:1-acyl-sn-glycerol-3-phosphate acyltransferase